MYKLLHVFLCVISYSKGSTEDYLLNERILVVWIFFSKFDQLQVILTNLLLLKLFKTGENKTQKKMKYTGNENNLSIISLLFEKTSYIFLDHCAAKVVFAARHLASENNKSSLFWIISLVCILNT